MKYMKEQQMPWLGMVYEGDFADRFRKQFKSVLLWQYVSIKFNFFLHCILCVV